MPSLDAGETFGRYTIVRHLATGGMAEIFLARAAGVGGFARDVVIKRIIPALGRQREYVEMFLDEARLAVTLQHPNIVETYEVGVVDGLHFIAMEYLPGRTLRAIQQGLPAADRRVPIEQSLAVLGAVASALDYAHARLGPDGAPLEIVHRDVSPQNVMVTPQGVVKLLDFGVASATLRIGQTKGGVIKGKLSYMSPEQCRGEPPDRRSDVFACGILLWELTLGRRLFSAPTDYDVLQKIVGGAVPPPRAFDRGYPVELERVVMRALAYKREDRFPTARALGDALEEAAQRLRLWVSTAGLAHWMESLGDLAEAQTQAGPPAQAAPEQPTRTAEPQALAPRPRRRWRYVAVAAATTLALATTGLALRHRRSAAPPAAAAARPPGPPRSARSTVRAPAPVPVRVPAPAPGAAEIAVAVADSVAGFAPIPDGAHAGRPLRARARPRARARAESAQPAQVGEGTLIIATSPWCEIAVDGVARGATPLSVRLGAGAHEIRLANREYGIARTLAVTVRPDETLRKKLIFPRY